MKTGRRGRGARRGPGGRGGRRRERGESTAAPVVVVSTERVEEPAQTCPGRSAPACSDQVLASKQQKANKALTRKRVANMPSDLEQRHKRRKAAKEEEEEESPSPLHEASPVTGDSGSDIDKEDQQADDLGVDHPAPAGAPTVVTDTVLPTNSDQALQDEIDRRYEFELRKTYRICNFD